MCAYQFIYTTKLNQLTVSDFFYMVCQTWCFILNVIICHFSGGGMVMWTTTHCFDFLCMFECNLMYIVSICTQLQTHTRTNQHYISPAAKTLFVVI